MILVSGMMFYTSFLFAQNQKNIESSFDKSFDSPPKSSAPHILWYWISNNISKGGITKDLEAMSKLGIRGVVISQIGYKDSPVGDVILFSDKWWDCLSFAMEEASRLGIEVTLVNSPGWSGTGGSWVKPEQAMRYLDVHEYRIKGPQKLVMRLPNYESNEKVKQSSLSFDYTIDKSKFKFQSVGVQAFPVKKESGKFITAKEDEITSIPQINGIEKMFDGDETTKLSLDNLPLTIEISSAKKITVRSFEIVPADIPTSIFCKVEYMNEKGEWNKIFTRKVNRNESRILASGFLPFVPVSVSFSPVTAQHYRLTITENDPDNTVFSKLSGGFKKEYGRIAEIRLSSTDLVSDYGEKQLANKAVYEKTNPDSYSTLDDKFVIKNSEILNLINKVDENGVLTWNVPPGEWIIEHFGTIQSGVQIHPVPQKAETGFAADVLNKDAIQSSFDSYIGQILKRIPEDKRKTFKGIFIDSYEQGTANWTNNMEKSFKEAYGYDPLPWLPVLKGHVVESKEQSDRFLWDLRRLVADLLPDNFEGALFEKSKENGLKLWHEPYGGHGFPGEFFNFGKYNDVPAGEFWVADKPGADFSNCRAATSVANIYGRNLVSAESFTSSPNFLYKTMPRDFKALGDWAFAQGINHFAFHLYIHQPEDKEPGINTWYGSEFNRNNNWFQDAGTYVDYIKRCSALLQEGKRQTDVAFYIGDDVPCDSPSLPYSMPKGYDFDFINYEVLMQLAKVENGRLVFPSGASYKVLVLPPVSSMRPELLIKLEEFVKAGLFIYGPRAIKSPSLKNFPLCDEEVQKEANNLWGKIDGKTILWNNYGLGKVCFGTSLDDFFSNAGLTPDAVLPPDFVYTHRKDNGSDIYFVANQKDEELSAEISFRVNNMQPEYLDALTGKRWAIKNYFVKGERTIIPLEFSRKGSCFIIFRQSNKNTINKIANFTTYKEVQNIKGNWKVKFTGNVNPPFFRTFNQLNDWSVSDDKGVKYFCGKATYSIDFLFNEKLSEELYLNLGRVESLAKVYLNGKEVTTLWCYPYRTNVSEFLKKGTNKLEIEIINQWWNRLIGDEQPGEIKTTNVSARLFWKANDKLVPSGLLGSVVLETTE
jgi:hypothetical protein